MKPSTLNVYQPFVCIYSSCFCTQKAFPIVAFDVDKILIVLTVQLGECNFSFTLSKFLYTDKDAMFVIAHRMKFCTYFLRWHSRYCSVMFHMISFNIAILFCIWSNCIGLYAIPMKAVFVNWNSSESNKIVEV